MIDKMIDKLNKHSTRPWEHHHSAHADLAIQYVDELQPLLPHPTTMRRIKKQMRLEMKDDVDANGVSVGEEVWLKVMMEGWVVENVNVNVNVNVSGKENENEKEKSDGDDENENEDS